MEIAGASQVATEGARCEAGTSRAPGGAKPWIAASQAEFVSGTDSSDGSADWLDGASEAFSLFRPVTPVPYPAHPNLSEYQFSRVLGKGAFGTVYLARRYADNHPCAVKVIPKAHCAFSYVYKSLKNEALILASLDNPFIVRIEAAFQNQNHLFIQLQLATNGTLEAYVEAYAPMNTSQAQFYICQMILALDYLHSKGLVHADVKPDNILVTDGGYLKLTDFGFARHRSNEDDDDDDSQGSSLMSSSGGCVGTTHYMSPETVRGDNFGPWIDWWALGVIFYRCLFACYPFDVERYPRPNRRYCKHDHLKVEKLIKEGHYEIPHTIEPPALSFLQRLLAFSIVARDITWGTIAREHGDYFRGIDWSAVYRRMYKPPFAPPRPPLDPHPRPAGQAIIDHAEKYADRTIATQDLYGGMFNHFHYVRTPWQVSKEGMPPIPIPPSSDDNQDMSMSFNLPH